ncbi:MAG: tyrosine-type recombinase/integrase [Candidatus Omnitrophica bacterium]|nr:tyrosine-type recombinase/integrase [Candidatus Omnitrophota bacterium]
MTKCKKKESGVVRKRPGSDFYYIDYYADKRRVVEKISTNEEEAKQALQERRSRIYQDKANNVKRIIPKKIEDFAQIFLTRHSKRFKKHSSYKRDIQLLGKILSFKSIKGKELHKIEVKDIEDYKAYRQEQVSNATVNRELACLKCLYNKAILWDNAKENPVKKVAFLKEPKYRDRYLDEVEIEKLLSECHGHLKAVVQIALNTGLRVSEILHLKHENLDFKKRLIHLDGQYTKNGDPVELPMNDTVLEVCNNIPYKLDSDYLFSHDHTNKGKKPGDRFNSVRTAFDKAVKRAGLECVVFHTLRHTYGSTLANNGVTFNVLKDLMRHKEGNMVFRYCHSGLEQQREALSKLNYSRKNQIDGYSMVTEKNPPKSADNFSAVTVSSINR